MKTDKPRGWYSEWHETAMHPTVTVVETEKDRPTLYLPDGTEMVAKPQIGFRPRGT